MTTMAERIRYFRTMSNFTQIKLANEAGLAVGTIRQYEGGKRQPKVEQLRKLLMHYAFPYQASLERLMN